MHLFATDARILFLRCRQPPAFACYQSRTQRYCPQTPRSTEQSSRILGPTFFPFCGLSLSCNFLRVIISNPGSSYDNCLKASDILISCNLRLHSIYFIIVIIFSSLSSWLYHVSLMLCGSQQLFKMSATFSRRSAPAGGQP